MKLNLFTNIGLRTSLHEIHESFASDVVDKAVLLTLLCRRSQEETAVECITVKTRV